MIIPFFIPIPIFIRNLFGKSDRDREIEGFCEKVRIEAKVSEDNDQKHKKLYAQLTNKEKEEIDNKRIGGYVFPDRSSYVNWQNMNMESIIESRKLTS